MGQHTAFLSLPASPKPGSPEPDQAPALAPTFDMPPRAHADSPCSPPTTPRMPLPLASAPGQLLQPPGAGGAVPVASRRGRAVPAALRIYTRKGNGVILSIDAAQASCPASPATPPPPAWGASPGDSADSSPPAIRLLQRTSERKSPIRRLKMPEFTRSQSDSLMSASSGLYSPLPPARHQPKPRSSMGLRGLAARKVSVFLTIDEAYPALLAKCAGEGQDLAMELRKDVFFSLSADNVTLDMVSVASISSTPTNQTEA